MGNGSWRPGLRQPEREVRKQADVRGAAGQGRTMPQVPGVTHRYVTVHQGTADAAQLHLAETGAGPTLLLLHGYLQHWYAWRRVLPLLADDYRLVCADLRGFGWSEQTRRGYDIASLAGDLSALIDFLDIGPALVLGDDLGARVAMRLARRSPERMTGLVALDVNHPYPARRMMLANLRRMWFTAFPLEYPGAGQMVLRHWPAFIRFLLRRGTGDPRSWPAEDLAEFVAAARASAHAGQQVMWQMVVKDMPGLLHRGRKAPSLELPVLLLAGDRDKLTPASLLDGDQSRAPRLTTQILSGCGHHLPIEAAEAVANATRAFASRLSLS
jgi:pimeloyl-ACP methyl ester carboxylesterase